VPYKDPAKVAEAQRRSRERRTVTFDCVDCGEPVTRYEMGMGLCRRCANVRNASRTVAQRRRRQRQRTQLAPVETAVVPSPAVDLGHLVQWSGIAAQARQRGSSEGERTRLALEVLREHGLSFRDAWAVATRGRESEVLAFARPAFERAYVGEPMTTLDRCAARLGGVLASLEDSGDAFGSVSVAA
jgi:hypothetical protein